MAASGVSLDAMRLKLKLPWFAQTGLQLEQYLAQRMSDLRRSYIGWSEETTLRRGFCDAIVELLRCVELEVDITPEELTSLDVQVLEHVATTLMGKIRKPGT